jgi:hypothetical protein
MLAVVFLVLAALSLLLYFLYPSKPKPLPSSPAKTEAAAP